MVMTSEIRIILKYIIIKNLNMYTINELHLLVLKLRISKKIDES